MNHPNTKTLSAVMKNLAKKFGWNVVDIPKAKPLHPNEISGLPTKKECKNEY